MSRTSWVAFQCSALAQLAEERDEQQRLFNVGYKKGMFFLSAINSHKIEKNDLHNETPIGFRQVMAGPSAEFMLGRAWESAAGIALEDIFTIQGKNTSVTLRKELARTKFLKKDCYSVQ